MCRTFRLPCDTDMPLERFVAQCRYVLADLAVGALHAHAACAPLAAGRAQLAELGVLALSSRECTRSTPPCCA